MERGFDLQQIGPGRRIYTRRSDHASPKTQTGDKGTEKEWQKQ